MLSQENSERMCKTGPATGMGLAFRRYWLPALQSSQVAMPDGDPVHVELLGEHFVAFRDTKGKVGILDENCCHRGASLLLGRVESGGIRCIYHGWKFAVDGTVLETPNVPNPSFKAHIRANAYPVREAGGLIWVYLGPADVVPDFPEWPWLNAPLAHRINTRHVHSCNYVQVLEGLVDSSHLGILHFNGVRASQNSELTFASKVGKLQADLAPRIEVEDTEFGFHYAAIRAIDTEDEQRSHLRITAFVCPFTVLNPNGDVVTMVVPRNDESAYFYHLFWDLKRTIGEEPLRSEQLAFIGLDSTTADGYKITDETHFLEGQPSRNNKFLQNRDAIRSGVSFSGLPGLIEEDVAVSVSAGATRDRSKESLSIADVAIGRLYRVLLRCERLVREGSLPIGVGIDAAEVIGTSGELAGKRHWRSLVPGHRPAHFEDQRGQV